MHRSIPAVISTAVAASPLTAAWSLEYGAVASAAARSSAATHTYAGSRAHMRWGTVQVTITVKSKRMTNVKASLPLNKARSRSINTRAAPILRREALQAQSANISAVSGATLTSHAYSQSLQAALNKAHI